MGKQKRDSVFWLSCIFELNCLAQCGIFFSPVGFKIAKGMMRMSLLVLTISALKYVIDANKFDGQTLRATVVATFGLQLLLTNALMSRKQTAIEDVIARIRKFNEKLSEDSENQQHLADLDRSVHFLIKFFNLLGLNHPLLIINAAIQQYMTGQTTSLLVCHISFAGFHCALRILGVQISGYSTIIARMLRERPIAADLASDKIIFSHCSELGRLVFSFNEICSEGSCIDLLISSGRNAFLGFQVMETIKRKSVEGALEIIPLLSAIFFAYSICSGGQQVSEQTEKIRMGIMESKWYLQSPESRKRLVPLLTMTQTPFRHHFKHTTIFDMETFASVLNGTYSFLTFLANFL